MDGMNEPKVYKVDGMDEPKVYKVDGMNEPEVYKVDPRGSDRRRSHFCSVSESHENGNKMANTVCAEAENLITLPTSTKSHAPMFSFAYVYTSHYSISPRIGSWSLLR